jgi:hypothetical protein
MGEVPPLVVDIGLLAQLLIERDGDLYFEFSWFQNVLADLKAIPSQRAALMRLMRDLLGSPVPNTPPNRTWYALPHGEFSDVYIVLPPDDTQSPETIGIGLLHQFSEAGLQIDAWLYVPLFSTPLGSPVIVTGSTGFPLEHCLTITGSTFTVGSVSFNGITFEGDVYFTGSLPNFTLTFNGMSGSQSVAKTLQGLQTASVRDWVNAVLANQHVDAWLRQNVGSSPFTVGQVLVATGILIDGEPYTFGSFDAFVNLTPAQIAEALLAAALKKLAANTSPIRKFGDGGIWVFGAADGANTDYGLRLTVPDISIPTSSGPTIVVQLGKLLSGDAADDTWISRSDPAGTFAAPGVNLTLLSIDSSNNPSFRPKLDLISLGFDVTGATGNPLFNVKGVTLNALEPRFLVSLDFASLGNIPWGVALRCDRLGIPLGNGVAGAAPSNPVAQNLLSSGSGGGDQEPVNPAFSASISKVFDPRNSTTLNVLLEQPDGGTAGTVWLPIQRAFGPLQCRRIGVSWPEDSQNRLLTFLFDGSVHLGALEIDLISLSLSLPLTSPGDISTYGLDLQGLAISYQSGPLVISGGLVKNTSTTPVEYDGEALINAASWSIAALGSYASLNGQPSLFIFARIGVTLGGPPFFFVTGLCAGFGYNRSLRIPAQDEVPQFPLLAGIDDPSKIGGPSPSPAAALAAMGDWVQPAQGANWFAVGVQFTSFELVRSNAVLVVLPTGDFQVAILGVSRMKLGQEGPEFAYVEMGLEIVVHPSAGFFGASAVISPNSYVLTPSCHLTGGFAFYVWYDGEHAGDFVVTFGGYHPAFMKPPWYPDEARLGFSWQVNGNVTIQGTSYFALTPSCVMGGGSLDVEFHAGDLRAWFTAYADFLFNWKPFYYIGRVGVSIGASYKIDLLFVSVTVSVELGADLEIWGPPTGGKVDIDWYIISFSVPFGDDPDPAGLPGYLAWECFQTLLPQNDSSHSMRAEEGDPSPLTNVITFAISDGIISKTADGRWLVRADALTFSVTTSFPLTEADLNNATASTAYKPGDSDPSYFVAVRPMGVESTSSAMSITVSGSTGTQNVGTGWNWTATLRDVPAALWGTPLPEKTTPATPSADTLPNRLVGVGGLSPIAPQMTGPPSIALANLVYFPIDQNDSKYLPLSATDGGINRQPQVSPTSLQTIADTIASDGVVAQRNAIFAALASFGYDGGANGVTTEIRDNVNLSYANPPMLGAPWQEVA